MAGELVVVNEDGGALKKTFSLSQLVIASYR